MGLTTANIAMITRLEKRPIKMDDTNTSDHLLSLLMDLNPRKNKIRAKSSKRLKTAIWPDSVVFLKRLLSMFESTTEKPIKSKKIKIKPVTIPV